MWYIQVFKKGTKDLVMEICTELETVKNSYLEYYKLYGYDAEVTEQISLNI